MMSVSEMLFNKWIEEAMDSKELMKALEKSDADTDLKYIYIAKRDGFEAGFEAGIKLALEMYKKL